MKRSPLDLSELLTSSPFPFKDLHSPLSGDLDLLFSPLADIPLGTGEQDWGVPLWHDSLPKVYTRMNPDFTVPVDGAPMPSIALVPQVSPAAGQFPVEVGAQTFLIDLEFVVFT